MTKKLDLDWPTLLTLVVIMVILGITLLHVNPLILWPFAVRP